MDELPAIQLSDLNEFITCKLCKGYLIDAVSITECLHPFKYSEEKRECPVCGILIHQSHPLNYMSFDRTLQDIVYKIVPDLRQIIARWIFLNRSIFVLTIFDVSEFVCDYFDENSTDLGKETHVLVSKENITGAVPSDSDGLTSNFDSDYHRKDEQVNIQLEPGSDNLEPLTEKYLRLSSRATVTHLRKYVAQQVLHDISKFHEIDIFIQNNEDGTFLGRDHVLKFVRVVYWNDVGVNVQ
ncbi:unnamed protein product [Schistosoma margrebowiei]|uniref:Uncharacterized protein n=1 Tax=Schistosoma margrebowiei TaxID=48269 RepID=A0A183MKH0_9TREM|nr:unnamed protein product [Schistosoma margrebowiei]